MDVSLLGGWLPWTLRLLTVLLVVAAVGRRRLRDRRFLLHLLPLTVMGAVTFGVLCSLLVREVFDITDPLPLEMWFWLTVAALAGGLAGVCWRGSRWWQRTAGPPATLLALLTSGVALNSSLGYFPTLADMYGELTNQALPQQITMAELANVHGNTDTGRIVQVDIPAVPSGFKHRTEYVYLPPAWFRSTHRPKLPVIEMIGGEYAVPDNWVRAGNAVKTADAFAKEHHGFAPVLVFADASGGFKVDTECVNGVPGRAGDHLVKDIPQFVQKNFGTFTSAPHWAIAGWSMGGTCAITLSVTHPNVFGHFLDISGDIGPNIGDKAGTVKQLYGGDAAAYDANDPLTVLAKHKKFPKGFSGIFADGDTEDKHIQQAHQLSDAATKAGIESQVYVAPGKHSWTFAQAVFQTQLPWFAKVLQVPGVK
ncbi:MAG: esterase family protein [Catenulispora sp.]|nr:esterase family protein [Catenulispora sp.]